MHRDAHAAAMAVAVGQPLHFCVALRGDEPARGFTDHGAGDHIMDEMLVRLNPCDADECGDQVSRDADLPAIALFQGGRGREAR